MNEEDERIAEQIWGKRMTDRYADRRQAAIGWLGKRYLLATPAKKPVLPALLRKQAG